MITDATELSELIQTTEDLIADDHVSIVLIRNTRERTPSGGQRPVVPVPQPAKDRYFGAVTGDPVQITRDEGEHALARHVIIGMPGDDIQEKDTFLLAGRKFEVYRIHPDQSYQVKGWVVERA